MKKTVGLLHGRLLLLLLLLCGGGCSLYAQSADALLRAERIYQWLVSNQADSIHAALNTELQAQLSPANFNGMLAQVEKQMGPLQQAGEWQTAEIGGHAMYYRDLQFERYRLSFLLSFDADGRLNTIRLMPAREPATAAPVAYDSTQVVESSVTVETDGFRLPALFTLPRAVAVSAAADVEVPCVVLVHGSGPNDCDETVGPNKPFRDLAWGLAERGIATLRYYKRTNIYAERCVPEGRVLDYDTEVVDDAVSAVKLAGTLPHVAADSIYVLGHSLGGTLAPRIAERLPELCGLIMLAGLARPLEDAYAEQVAYLLSLTGHTADARQQLDEVHRQVAQVKRIGTAGGSDSISLLLNLPLSYWKLANTYRPVAVAARLSLPMLILQGERDYQVTMQDFGLWRSGLLRCPNAYFKSYPRLNHLFQEGKGKSTPLEYQQASPIPTYVMDDIAGFVHSGRLSY